MAHYLEFRTADNSTILVEVDAPPNGAATDAAAAPATLEDALGAAVRRNAQALMKAIQGLGAPPDEAALSFGLRATGEPGQMAIARSPEEAAFSFTLTWRKTPPPAAPPVPRPAAPAGAAAPAAAAPAGAAAPRPAAPPAGAPAAAGAAPRPAGAAAPAAGAPAAPRPAAPAAPAAPAGPPPAPTIAAVTPKVGHVSGGTAVVVGGRGFQTGAQVLFGDSPLQDVVVEGGVRIRGRAPARGEGTVEIVVVNPDGQRVALANGFSYVTGPAVARVMPAAGPVAGSPVTISGENFDPSAKVEIAGVPLLDQAVKSATEISGRLPAHEAGWVEVKVTNADGKVGSIKNGYLYAEAPKVTAVTPASGPAGGGNAISIIGENFLRGPKIELGGTPIVEVVWESANKVNGKAPAHDPGVVDVKFTNQDGQNTLLAAAYTFAGAPVVTTVTPESGATAGGNTITITGEHFLTGAKAEAGGSPLLDVTVKDASTITARMPEHAAGTVEVAVINPDEQRGARERAYTFMGPPKASHVTPDSGPAAGGLALTIACEGIQPGVQVEFGGVPLVDVTPKGQFLIAGTAPAHAPGPVDVVLINPDGQRTTLEGGFTFIGAPAPKVNSVSPDGGPATGGTAISISCEDFQPGVRVEFGGVPLDNVTPLGRFVLNGTAPAHAPGAVDVVLINPDGQRGTLTGGYTYAGEPAPKVSSVSPDTGPTSGGTQISISCEDFQSGVRVEIGGVPLTELKPLGKFMLTGITPAHAPGVFDVVLINPDDQRGTLAKGYTYTGAAPAPSAPKAGS